MKQDIETITITQYTDNSMIIVVSFFLEIMDSVILSGVERNVSGGCFVGSVVGLVVHACVGLDSSSKVSSLDSLFGLIDFFLSNVDVSVVSPD